MVRLLRCANMAKKRSLLPIMICVLVFASGFVACASAQTRAYFVGDVYEAYNSNITLNSVAWSDAITIDDNDLQADDDNKFLVLNVTIMAKEDIVLENQRFKVSALDIVANKELSKGLNNGIDYLSDYALAHNDSITFNVVFSLAVIDDSGYSVNLYLALFQVHWNKNG